MVGAMSSSPTVFSVPGSRHLSGTKLLLRLGTVVPPVLAFEAVVTHQWGSTRRRFLVVHLRRAVGRGRCRVFPFMLKGPRALPRALWALQRGSRGLFVCFAVLTLGPSPVAFLLLAVVSSARGSREGQRPRPNADHCVERLSGLAAFSRRSSAWRFPSQGRYPFSAAELAAACAFCILGARADVESRRRLGSLRWLFVVYLVVCVVAYAVPLPIGIAAKRRRAMFSPTGDGTA